MDIRECRDITLNCKQDSSQTHKGILSGEGLVHVLPPFPHQATEHGGFQQCLIHTAEWGAVFDGQGDRGRFEPRQVGSTVRSSGQKRWEILVPSSALFPSSLPPRMFSSAYFLSSAPFSRFRSIHPSGQPPWNISPLWHLISPTMCLCKSDHSTQVCAAQLALHYIGRTCWNI